MVLSKNSDGELTQSKIELPASIKNKKYRQDFRTRFCEGLLSRKILICEGATETTALPVVARRLAELNAAEYASLEMLGFCVIDAGTETMIADTGCLYKKLGKKVFALCDKQTISNEEDIKKNVDELFMHDEKGFEDLVLNNTTEEAMKRFISKCQWPQHLQTKFPKPPDDPVNALKEYFVWTKGNYGIADFLIQCNENEIPLWIKEVCRKIKALCSNGII